MSTTDTFTALGAGNGFPACVSRVSADDPDFPSGALLNGNLSLEQVMHLYWNIESISVTVDRSDLPPDGSSTSNTTDQAPFGLASEPLGTISEPFERVCGNSLGIDADPRASSPNSFRANSRISFGGGGGYLNGGNLIYDKDNEAYQIGWGALLPDGSGNDELFVDGFVDGFGGRGAPFITALLTVPYTFENPHEDTVYKSTTLAMPSGLGDITFYYSTRDGDWEATGGMSGTTEYTVSISANFYTYS